MFLWHFHALSQLVLNAIVIIKRSKWCIHLNEFFICVFSNKLNKLANHIKNGYLHTVSHKINFKISNRLLIWVWYSKTGLYFNNRFQKWIPLFNEFYKSVMFASEKIMLMIVFCKKNFQYNKKNCRLKFPTFSIKPFTGNSQIKWISRFLEFPNLRSPWVLNHRSTIVTI